MAEPVFFPAPEPVALAEIIALTRAEPTREPLPGIRITGIASLGDAEPGELTFLDNPRYLDDAAHTRAAACLCLPRHVAALPAETLPLLTTRPYAAFAEVAALFYPDAMRPGPVVQGSGIAATAVVDPTASLEAGVIVEPGAVVGAGAAIGARTTIGPGAVVGPNVHIGRDCSIGAGVSVLFSLIGDRVILHPGVRIGQDGFGYVSDRERHLKIPQLGRVIIQDDVEIGAATSVDRGALGDTVVGAGSKIDNQVQIGHNVVIGRGCIIVAQVGIAGSATVGDFVVIGGQTGINGHVTIGSGAKIAAVSAVHGDVPAGARWGGAPARPVTQWLRDQLEMRPRRRGVIRDPGPADEGPGGG